MHTNEFEIMGGDIFYPHVLFRSLQGDFSTYLRAVGYFYGISLKPGEITSFIKADSTVNKRENRPRLPEEEEYRLAKCLLADQHELCHHNQFISTAVGSYCFDRSAWYWDFLKQSVARLSKQFSATNFRSKLKLPLLRSVKEIAIGDNRKLQEIHRFMAINDLLIFHRRLFDNINITAYEAVNVWNTVADLFARSRIREDDDVILPHFCFPVDDSKPANPPGITLGSLLESSARCLDFIKLHDIRPQDNVYRRIYGEFYDGKEYTSLIDMLRTVVEPECVLQLVTKLSGIALQSPLTSRHFDFSSQENDLQWGNLAPPYRFYKIVEAIKNGLFLPKEILEDNNVVDGICDYFQWPRVSNQLVYYASRPQFRGLNALVSFFVDQHSMFCKLATSSHEKLVWLLDTLWTGGISGQKLQDWAGKFYPPFHLGGGQIVTHKTCNFGTMLDMYLVFATSVAAKELLYSSELSETKKLVGTYFHWANRLQGEFAQRFLGETWPATFEKTFGFELQDIGLNAADFCGEEQ